MTDNMTKAQRSLTMSRIRDRDTKPELDIRRRLFSRGLRGYRLRPKLPGKPDIAFGKAKVAVFIDGCFWHGCPKCYARPASRQNYWDEKLIRNVARDKIVNKCLKKMGWTTLRFWEHDTKRNPDQIVVQVRRALRDRTVEV
jgi:DNA mismatch endonuclease, patch repair protein